MAEESDKEFKKIYDRKLTEARASKQVAKDLASEEKKIEGSLKNQLKSQFGINDLLKESKINSENIAKAIEGANKSQVQFQKSLGLSVSDSTKLTRQIAISATFSKNIGVSFLGTQKAITNINKSLGTGTNLITKQAEAAGRFAITLGMSEEAQNNLAKRSIQIGQSVENLVLGQVGVVKGVEAELGARLNIADVINEAASIGGQIRAQLGGNVNEITRAVAVSKELGFELKAIAGTSKSLLDFQSNIEAELEAELLTGKQLNLEQARLYALTGDYEGLTREIANNVGDFYEFSKLNVLQQDAIAKSVGMTSDQLSDQLFNQSSINELKEKAREEGDKETLANLENLDIQKQFEMITLRIKSAFVSIATILEPVFAGMALMANNMDVIAQGTAAFVGYLAIAKGIQMTMLLIEKRQAILRLINLRLQQKLTAARIVAAMTSPIGIALAAGAIAAGATYMARNRSIGGPVAAGKPYMVGERGPELIVPTNSGNVIPNNQLSGGGGKGRSDTEIISLATKAAARSISVDFNTPRFNSINSLDAVFA
jgi:hypothetical protein